MTDFVVEKVAVGVELESDNSITRTFGPPTAGLIEVRIVQAIERLGDDASLDDHVKELTKAECDRVLRFEILDGRGREVAEGLGSVKYVVPTSPSASLNIPQRPWSVRITSTYVRTVEVDATVSFVGTRAVLAKEVPIAFLDQKLDVVWNDQQPLTVRLENKWVMVSATRVQHTFANLEFAPAWTATYPDLSQQIDLGRRILDEGTHTMRIKVRATTFDDQLALKVRVSFAPNTGRLDIPGLTDRDIHTLTINVWLVLTTGKLPTFVPRVRAEVSISGGMLESSVTAAVRGLLENEIETRLQVARRGDESLLRSLAETVLGWILLEAQPTQIVGYRQHLEVLYPGPPPSQQEHAPLPTPSTPLDPGNLSKIDHIVVLMMENRSFDHMLGYLSLGGRTDVNGLTGKEKNPDLQGHSRAVFPLTTTRFDYDPGHSYDAAKKQRGGYSIPIPGTLPGTGRPPSREGDPDEFDDLEGQPEQPRFSIGRMKGFVIQFAERLAGGGYGLTHAQIEELKWNILGYHTAVNVRAYDRLAREYAVCDAWFSSHPGHTWPNRFVTITGNLNLGPGGAEWYNPHLSTFVPVSTKSIFDHLLAADVEWRYYEHDFCFARVLANYAQDQQRVLPIERFYEDARQRRLKPVTFIDPNLTDAPPGNDDHAPSDIADGQALVDRIYIALRAGAWDKTLFIITYDEHGGFYDHVYPADGQAIPFSPYQGELIDHYGMRVPAFVVSPWVRRGRAANDTYDHTSILKTIIRRFLSQNPPFMGARVAAARDIGPLLSRTTPRTDTPPTLLDPAASRLTPGVVRPSPPPARPADDFHAFMTGLRDRLRRP